MKAPIIEMLKDFNDMVKWKIKEQKYGRLLENIDFARART